jgi:integrase/recombinase XerD
MQLDYAIEGYWLAKRRDFSTNTVNDYTLTFRRLIEFVGKTRDLLGISSDDINRFLNYLRDDLELSPKTILNHWIALSSFWTWVERDLGLPHIIRGKVNRPRPRRRLSAAYTEAEIRELLAACEKCGGWDRAHGQRMDVKRPSALRDRALMLVLLDTGIRASELTALKMRDYEPKRGQLIIHHGKGDKKRVVFLGSAAKQGVWRYLATRPGARQDDPLFATREGTAMQRTGLRLLIFRIGQHAGVPDAGVHRFRHTFAVNFLRNGGNLLALQDLLGHERLDTVRIYAKQAEVDLERQQKGASPADRWKL